MADKSHTASHMPKSIDTLVGAGMRIEGNIECSGVLRVQGEIAGNVSCDERGHGGLIVDTGGTVTGAVNAAHVLVRGVLLGPVCSRHSIEIQQGGSLAGDVAFRQLAIQAGGVVEGALHAIEGTEAETSGLPPDAMGETSPTGKPRATRRIGSGKIVAAALVAGIIAAGAWLALHPEATGHGDKALNDSALKQAASLDSPLASGVELRAAPGAGTGTIGAGQNEPVADASASNVPASASSAAASVESQPSKAPARTDDDSKIVAVRGANPNRPAGVFLLISNEPSVLYRKARGEADPGTRVTVPAGEKASVAIGSNELIRVQGKDVVIFFQGAKVPREAIDSGAWLSFVPR